MLFNLPLFGSKVHQKKTQKKKKKQKSAIFYLTFSALFYPLRIVMWHVHFIFSHSNLVSEVYYMQNFE